MEQDAGGVKGIVTVHQNSVANTYGYRPRDVRALMQSWDPTGVETKGSEILMPTGYQYLLQYGIVTDQSAVLDYVHRTLERMSYGGLYDCARWI